MREIRLMKLQMHPLMARIFVELQVLCLIWVRMKIDQCESDQTV